MAERARTRKQHLRPAPRPAAPRQAAPSAVIDEVALSPETVQLLADPRLGSQRAHLMQRFQRAHGNAFVARLVQRSAVVDAPAPPRKLDPRQDPNFEAVEQKIGHTAKQERRHASARSKVHDAQGAAVGPPNDMASQAAAAQTDKMAQQQPGEFDKKAFIDAVKQAIEAAAPRNLEQADDFKKSGKAGQVKDQVSGLVGKGKQQSEAGIEQANTEAPDASTAKAKNVTPMRDEKVGPSPGGVGAAQAIPSPKTAAETSMAAGPAEVNQQMADADVTEDQLKKSNEPQFNDALDAKKTAEQHSQQAPEDYQKVETQTLAKAGADAQGTAAKDLSAMHGDKARVLAAVMGNKTGAKTQDEAKRAEVAGKIETFFNQTRTDVTAILDGLDAKVNAAFDAGEKDARNQFEAYVDQKMTAYKDDRYSGVLGWERWLEDKFLDMPSEVNAFYAEGRNRYLKQMEGVISRVADLVGAELGKAKKRIADGRQQVKEYVASQPKALQQVAKNAEQQISGKFDQLAGDVNSKQDSLVQSLADKYVKARDDLDARIDQLKAENKGLVSAAKDAIGGVIQTIKQLKDMLLNVLQKAANVIGDIIKDPITFLGNLVGAIKQGLNQFVANIGTHLKKGLMGWLFGTLGSAGLQLPDSFDLKGILSLVLQVLGLTYENVRAIAVKIVGDKVVSAIEKTVKFFVSLATEGPSALWQWIKDKIDEINIKDMVIGAIKDFVITKIITAGITWLIGLLNPAAAFIKACKMIYDVIMFFIERGSEIMEFVNSILDGLGAIVSGSLGAAANLVESSLAKILPLAISFLASLLGVGGIAEKIKEIIEKIRAPITKVITAVIGPIIRPLKKLYDKGAKFVTSVVDKGKALGQKALGAVKGKLGIGKPRDTKPEEAEGNLALAMKRVHILLNDGRTTAAGIRKALPGIQKKFGLSTLTLTEGTISKGRELVTVEGQVQRTTDSGEVPAGSRDLDPLIYRALVSLTGPMYAATPPAVMPAPPTATTRRGRQAAAQEQAAQQDLIEQQRRGRIESLGGTIQQALGNIQNQYLRAKYARATDVRDKLTATTAPNVFQAQSRTFFVDQFHNDYIVPSREVKVVDINPTNLKIGMSDESVSSKYSYTIASNALSTAQLKSILLGLASAPGGNPSPGERPLTMFLAAFAAEPSRYSVAHVTNLLLVSDPNPPTGNAFNQLSMTQGGSDPGEGRTPETDPRLAGMNPGRNMPKKVTDRDIALVKGRKDIMDQIEKANVPGVADDTLVTEIARIIRSTILDWDKAHTTGPES